MINRISQNIYSELSYDVSINGITRILLQLGIMPQHLGFGYLICAVSVLCKNPYGYYSRSSDYYDEIFKRFQVNKSRASRCMSYAIYHAWSVSRNPRLRKLFPEYSDAFAPTVSEFVCRISVEIIDFTLHSSSNYAPSNDDLSK